MIFIRNNMPTREVQLLVPNCTSSLYEGHFLVSEIARMEKSPLLANGYNAPPTHLGPMGFMHQHALMSPGMPHHGVPRPDGSIIKGQPMHNMEALAR